MPDYDRSFRRRATGPLEGLADLRAGQRPDPRGSRFDQWPDQRPDPRPDQRADQRFDQRLDQWIATGRQLVDGVAGARPGSRASGRPQPGGRAGGLPRPGGLGRWVEDKLEWLLEDDEAWREPWEGQALGRRSRSGEPAWDQPGQEPGWPGSAAEPAEVQNSPWARRSGEVAFDPSPGRDPWGPGSSRTSAGQPSTSQPPIPAPGRDSAPTRWPEGAAARAQAPAERRQELAPSGPRVAGSQAPQSQPRRPLEALSRRGTPLLPPRSPGSEAPEPAADGCQDWPDDASFTVARWQRPAGPDPQAQAPLPLQASLRPTAPGSSQAFDSVPMEEHPWQQRPMADSEQGPPLTSPPAPGTGRPVPRSTRRR